jgi:hypothetical protein
VELSEPPRRARKETFHRLMFALTNCRYSKICFWNHDALGCWKRCIRSGDFSSTVTPTQPSPGGLQALIILADAHVGAGAADGGDGRQQG